MEHILVTGCAGFIGSHLCERLLENNYKVTGIDNFDTFYSKEVKVNNMSGFVDHECFTFYEVDLSVRDQLFAVDDQFDVIIHLAGKAGVRPSILDPQAYISSNITATNTVLEYMKEHGLNKLIFASSSSVYGNEREIPFKESMDVTYPISPYASSKKSAELLNYTYHHLYQFSVLNLRFFTVYGERQRPDLAIHKFVDKIVNDQPITMFGDGSSSRDYTYVGDTVSGILGALSYIKKQDCIYEIVNLGNNSPIKLKDLISTVEGALDKKAIVEHLPMQPGDVDTTFADITKAQELFGYQSETPFEVGIEKFVNWYRVEKVVE